MKLQAELQPQSWWDTLKETLSLEQLSKRFTVSNLIEIATYGGVGFISGFLIKKYGRYVIGIALVAALSIWVLTYLNVITIDWAKAKTILGVSDTQTFDGLWKFYSAWIKEHMLAAISVVVGFLIGYRIG